MMRSYSLTFLALIAASDVYALNPRHVEILNKRQTTAAPTSPTVTSPAATGTPPPATAIPPIDSLTSGMPSGATLPATATFSSGASPPVSGAPGLPTPFVFRLADWPAQDKVAPTDSDEVTMWMKELDGVNIPDIPPTKDGSCGGDPAAAANASSRGWWTCGGHTRPTDIVACPDKLTWGISFDDGPSPYTQKLLQYLDQKKIAATFFVVGSRVIERPTVLIEEYMAGHEISIHTWSHRPLTTLTNAQIVAELGWTRHAIRTVLGVTPTTMRPPFGDIDDRVRAIALAMGLTPIMWTRAPDGSQFDTNDWRVPGGLVTGKQSLETFQSILNNATTINTGFIVLQHDLYEVAVDIAVGYTLNAALNHNPKFNLMPIGQCIKTPTTNLYFETTQNTTFPTRNKTEGGYDIDGDGVTDVLKSSSLTNSIPLFGAVLAAWMTTLFV